MLDKYLKTPVEMALRPLVNSLAKTNIHPCTITITGFLVGIVGMILIAFQFYLWGLVAILLNRVFDGIDGQLARSTKRTTDAGAFLDTVFDFIFYSGIVLAFGISDEQNRLSALVLMLSFVSTCASFLGFATLAAKNNMQSDVYPNKTLYYLGGITEGTETIAVFILFCLFYNHFPTIAYGFAALCTITTITRIIQGYWLLKAVEHS